jgi:hypothetical protein
MMLCIGVEEEEVIIVEIEEAKTQETEVEAEEVAMPVIVTIKILAAISVKTWNISNRNILDMGIESVIQIIEM